MLITLLLFIISALLSTPSCAVPRPDLFRIEGRDLRNCGPFPQCGGLYLRTLNLDTKIYVGSILVAHLDPSIVKDYNYYFNSLGYNLIILRGSLVAHSVKYPKVLNLNVTSVYLGYPGVKVDLSEPASAFYQYFLKGNSTRIASLNSDTTYALGSRMVFPPVTPAFFANRAHPADFIDKAFQMNQILKKGAIVFGSYTKLESLPQPLVLILQQVFIRLPVVPGLCARLRIVCDPHKGQDSSWTRNAELCSIPACIPRGGKGCTEDVLECPEGYKAAIRRWQPGVCPQFVCDPLFLPATKMSENVAEF